MAAVTMNMTCITVEEDMFARWINVAQATPAQIAALSS